MIPGIGTQTETLLRTVLQPDITALRVEALVDWPMQLLTLAEAAALGVEAEGSGELVVAVTDRERRIGRLRVQSGGRDNVICFDNAGWGGNCFGNIRMLGSDCLALFGDIGDDYVALHDVLMRSNRQILFWGTGSTAVGLSVEIEGEDRVAAIGDDALISNGVWIRNYDMHALHDLASGAQINRPPGDVVLERHVWLGQEALLLSCERIGMGSVIGARAMVKGRIPPRVAAAWTPARVLRESVSWGRHPYGMTDAERLAIGLAALPRA